MGEQQTTNRAHNFQDLTGQIFFRLTVLTYAETRNRRAVWLCRCVCGTEKLITGKKLVNGNTVSCGCWKRTSQTTHGGCYTSEYSTWKHVVRRCHSPSESGYEKYGGRGITVCERWRSFENFLADMGPKPSPKHSIDRIDNNGNYEPRNCRWATVYEQLRNRSNSRYYTYQGRRLVMADWAREIGIPVGTLRTRLLGLQWSTEKALTTPVSPRHRKNRLGHI